MRETELVFAAWVAVNLILIGRLLVKEITRESQSFQCDTAYFLLHRHVAFEEVTRSFAMNVTHSLQQHVAFILQQIEQVLQNKARDVIHPCI